MKMGLSLIVSLSFAAPVFAEQTLYQFIVDNSDTPQSDLDAKVLSGGFFPEDLGCGATDTSGSDARVISSQTGTDMEGGHFFVWQGGCVDEKANGEGRLLFINEGDLVAIFSFGPEKGVEMLNGKIVGLLPWKEITYDISCRAPSLVGQSGEVTINYTHPSGLDMVSGNVKNPLFQMLDKVVAGNDCFASARSGTDWQIIAYGTSDDGQMKTFSQRRTYSDGEFWEQSRDDYLTAMEEVIATINVRQLLRQLERGGASQVVLEFLPSLTWEELLVVGVSLGLSIEDLLLNVPDEIFSGDQFSRRREKREWIDIIFAAADGKFVEILEIGFVQPAPEFDFGQSSFTVLLPTDLLVQRGTSSRMSGSVALDFRANVRDTFLALPDMYVPDRANIHQGNEVRYRAQYSFRVDDEALAERMFRAMRAGAGKIVVVGSCDGDSLRASFNSNNSHLSIECVPSRFRIQNVSTGVVIATATATSDGWSLATGL